MSTKKVVWNEKISATEFNTIYPRTVAEQVVLNNTINNNLGIDVDSRLDTALEHISDTDKRIRAQGTSTGTSGALELSVPVFTLIDGIMARVKIHTDTAEGATLNVNATGAKPIIRIDGEPIDLVLKQGTWCIFIYSSTLDSWIFEGWSTKTVVKTAIFTESGSWTVPANVTSVDVFLYEALLNIILNYLDYYYRDYNLYDVLNISHLKFFEQIGGVQNVIYLQKVRSINDNFSTRPLLDI